MLNCQPSVHAVEAMGLCMADSLLMRLGAAQGSPLPRTSYGTSEWRPQLERYPAS